MTPNLEQKVSLYFLKMHKNIYKNLGEQEVSRR